MTPEEKAAFKRDAARAREIEKQQAEDLAEDNAIKKLLLLGAGESGKSTLFKQMTTMYGRGFTDDDLAQFRKVLHNNVITSIQTLILQSDLLDEELGGTKISEDLKAEKEYVSEYKVDEDTPLTPELAENIKKLWKDEGVQKTFEHSARYQLPDSCGYLMGRLDDLAAETYVPTEDDAMRARSRTTGIVHIEFELEDTAFSMFDVGGQRNERRKWIYCFDNVTAVIFVAAISEYDQVCFEDEHTNRIDEALKLFGEVANSEYFKDTSIILFLNKRDKFDIKLKKVPLTVFDKDYDGGEDKEKAYEYFQARFQKMQKIPDQVMYAHVTCATDKDNVKHVFNAVKDTIVRNSLKQGGLIA